MHSFVSFENIREQAACAQKLIYLKKQMFRPLFCFLSSFLPIMIYNLLLSTAADALSHFDTFMLQKNSLEHIQPKNNIMQYDSAQHLIFISKNHQKIVTKYIQDVNGYQ